MQVNAKIEGNEIIITITQTVDEFVAPITEAITKGVQDTVTYRRYWGKDDKLLDQVAKEVTESARFRGWITAMTEEALTKVTKPSVDRIVVKHVSKRARLALEEASND